MNTNTDNSGTNENLPGYPHYPSEDDITNPDNGMKKVQGDVEDLANSASISRRVVSDRDQINESLNDEDAIEDLGIVQGTEADVTADDLILLGDRNTDQDMNDDEDTGNARVDQADLDNDKLDENGLDIPGEELDDRNEAIGEEDEENNFYSIGGDRHDNLEEDQA